MKRTQIYPFRANPAKCAKLYQNVQNGASPICSAARPILLRPYFPGNFTHFSPIFIGFIPLYNGFWGYITHFLIPFPPFTFHRQMTGYPFCVISIRPICTWLQIWSPLCPGAQAADCFTGRIVFPSISVSCWFASVCVLAAVAVKWYDNQNHLFVCTASDINRSLRKRKVSYFADR